jgi:hypothetical protein
MACGRGRPRADPKLDRRATPVFSVAFAADQGPRFQEVIESSGFR